MSKTVAQYSVAVPHTGFAARVCRKFTVKGQRVWDHENIAIICRSWHYPFLKKATTGNYENNRALYKQARQHAKERPRGATYVLS